jgi:hypothetical protein
MSLLSLHKCSGLKLHCFQCNKPVCPGCLATTRSGMMCKRCGRLEGHRSEPGAVGDLVKMQAYSVGYGALTFGVLGMFAYCVT